MALIRDGYQGVVLATFTQGQSLTDIVSLGNTRAVAFVIPASLNGATTLSFQGSYDGENFFEMCAAATGTALSYTVAVSTWVVAVPADFLGCDFLKIRAGAAGAGVVQSAKSIGVVTQAV